MVRSLLELGIQVLPKGLVLGSLKELTVKQTKLTDLTGIFATHDSTSVTGGFKINFVGLKTLELGFNKIAQILKGTFVGMPNLEWIGLAENQITTIEPKAFHELDRLTTL